MLVTFTAKRFKIQRGELLEAVKMENILIFRCFADVSIRSQKGSFHWNNLKCSLA